jgi:hypothetical protein
MSESAVTNGAETRKPSWYLARGSQQWGPLADRELLLLAEKGGLRGGDLLWRPGFDAWKPLDALLEAGVLTESNSPHPTMSPSGDAAESVAAAEAAEPAPKVKKSLRERFYEELKSFLIIVSYLWLVFLVFLVHEWTVLASHQIGFRFYGLAVVNALVLGKVMLIAEGLHFAEGLKDRPLIYPIAFKSIAFTTLLMISYIIEEIAVGWFHGKTVIDSFPKIGGGGVAGVLTTGAIMCVALVPFFSFREIARAIGEAEFRAMMLGPAEQKRRRESPEPEPAHR